jgi:hypothetical protein
VLGSFAAEELVDRTVAGEAGDDQSGPEYPPDALPSVGPLNEKRGGQHGDANSDP